MSLYLRKLILFLFLLISCSPLKNYQGLPEVKAWEPDIAKFEALDRSEIYSPEAVLFTGSSSIRRWETITTDMEPYEVIKRGYGGARLSDFAVYADRIFSHHPCRAAVIFVANDITGSEQDKTPEEVKRLFSMVLKSFRKTHPETPFFWVSVTPTPSRWKAWPEIMKASDLIHKECNKHNKTYFIETGFAFINEKGKPRGELFGPDSLHLNQEGYKVWSGIIKNELNRVLQTQ